MKSQTTPDFWNAYSSLPSNIKIRARLVYKLWIINPRHPSLRFKKTGNVWSIRIGDGYRALALMKDDTVFWFWIGTHDQYLRFINDA